MARPKKAIQATEPVPTTPQLELTPDEIRAIMAIRERVNETQVEVKSEQTIGIEQLAQALTLALKAAQPPEKKTQWNRKKVNPWTPKDGSAKILKFKRPMYHHGIPLNPKTTLNEDCLLLDKLKPGIYCSGHVRVTKRKDNGLDIDYPIRTAGQRLKLVNQFGITSFNSLLQRLIDERNDPRKYASPDDLDD